MKKLVFFAMLLVAHRSLFSQATFQADRDSLAEQQIIQLEFLLANLIAKGDIDTYATYLADDYTRIAANGVVSTKEQVLDGFRKTTKPGKMTPHDLDVRIYGSTAILRAILDIDSNEGKRRTSIITKVFIKRNGKWYMASLQGTSLQR